VLVATNATGEALYLVVQRGSQRELAQTVSTRGKHSGERLLRIATATATATDSNSDSNTDDRLS
jgi:hypothetical protein